MVYGTSFEQLEDDEKSAISKRPKGVQDEIVTDERGRRRFHGAFTGGFSAGYFNTAGSKHGWVPQTFKSSREDRAEKVQQAAHDFMDEEDLGEFGIAARKLRPKVDFMDSLLSSSTPGEKRLLAWERSSTTLSSSGAGKSTESEGTSLVGKLTEMLRPVSDSVGVRLLKKMGWRPGKGIGAKMSRRELERQKFVDAKNAGRNDAFDEKAVREVEEHVQGGTMEFSPDDIAMVELKPKEDVHGLGYRPLQESGVLSQKYGVMESALRVTKKSKGIRGQAFGVGAFEEEDEDIYTNFDLTQYDFEVGASSSLAAQEVPKFDSTFVPASASGKGSHQNFFLAPQPPPGWRPHHHRPKINAHQQKGQLKLPENVAKISERLTPFQRAKLLGERDHSVMEMLSSADREKLRGRERRAESERERKGGRGGTSIAEPFEEEPMKAHRFKQFVNYLKRGIPFPQPVDMTRLEWDRELAQFQDALPPDLRALLPEVRDRQKPLAKIDFAHPIAEHLKSRFEKETGTAEDIKHAVIKDERVEAVRMKQFGAMTRQKYAWHPARDLCKRFNVPNPYPDSQLVGAPGLSRTGPKDYSAQYSLMDLGGLRDTAAELASQQRRQQHHHRSRFDQKGPENGGNKTVKQEEESIGKEEEKGEGREEEETVVPMELLAAIFGDDEDKKEEEESSKEEDEEPIVKLAAKRRSEDTSRRGGGEQKGSELGARKGVVTVLDLVEDDDVYGPAMPPANDDDEKMKNGRERMDEEERRRKIGRGKVEGTEEDVITVESEDSGWEEAGERQNGGDRKKINENEAKRKKKERKKKKKHAKKHKKEKRKGKRRRSKSTESSTSSLSSD